MTGATIIPLQCPPSAPGCVFGVGDVRISSDRNLRGDVNLIACVLECVLDADLAKITSISRSGRPGRFVVEVRPEFDCAADAVPLARKISDLIMSLGGGHGGVSVGRDGRDDAQWLDYPVGECFPDHPLRSHPTPPTKGPRHG